MERWNSCHSLQKYLKKGFIELITDLFKLYNRWWNIIRCAVFLNLLSFDRKFFFKLVFKWLFFKVKYLKLLSYRSIFFSWSESSSEMFLKKTLRWILLTLSIWFVLSLKDQRLYETFSISYVEFYRKRIFQLTLNAWKVVTPWYRMHKPYWRHLLLSWFPFVSSISIPCGLKYVYVYFLSCPRRL